MYDEDFWNKKSVIYYILNRINGKAYIGKTVRELWRRIKQHRTRPESCIGDAIKKYGFENFSVFVLEECATPEELNEREKYWIKTLHTKTPYGYNLTDGGDGGKKAGIRNRPVRCLNTGEVFESIKQAAEHFNLKGHKISVVCRKKRFQTGGLRFEYCDSPFDPEERLREAHKTNTEKIRCVETNEIFESVTAAARHFGFKPATVNGACTGAKSSAHGYHFEYCNEEKRAAAEIRRSQIAPHSKAVLCINTGIIYKSIAEASRKTNIHSSAISSVCSGKHNTAGGYHWRFVSED